MVGGDDGEYNATEWAGFAVFNSLPNRVNVDWQGNGYPQGAYCLTQACLDNTVDYYTNTGLKTLTSGAVPLAVTVPHLNGLLFLIPAIIGLTGLVALLMFRRYAWAKSVAGLTAALLLIFLPLVWLFALVMFPFLILQGDACYGGLNLGYQVLTQHHDAVCAAIGGTGSADQCSYDVDGFSIVLNLPQLYVDVLGGKCDDGQVDDAVLALFNSVRASAAVWPQAKVAAAITAFNNNTDAVQLQPRLTAVLQSAAGDMSGRLGDFITAAAGQLTCQALAADWAAVHSSVCCGVTTSLYWFFSSWTLIGFTMMGCGVPAAICGRKRFAADIPDKELKVIDRYFSKDRVLKEEGYLRRARGSLGGEKVRPGSRGGSVAPLNAEVDAIEMAYLRAEKEKMAAGEAAPDPAAAAAAAGPDPSAPPAYDEAGEAGEGGMGPLHVGEAGALSARDRIDVIVASPSGSGRVSVSRGSHEGADADDRRGVNATLGADARSRRRPQSLDHPLALNHSRSGQSLGGTLTPSPQPLTPGVGGWVEGEEEEEEEEEEGKVAVSEAPTPMAILVHRPSQAGRGHAASAGSSRGAVFSYAQAGEEEEEVGGGQDPASYANKWPSLSLGGLEEKKGEEDEGGSGRVVAGSVASVGSMGSVSGRSGGSRSGRVTGYAATPIQMAQVGTRLGSMGGLGSTPGSRVAAVSRSAEGVPESGSVESSLDESTSEEDISEDEDGGNKDASGPVPMPRFQ